MSLDKIKTESEIYLNSNWTTTPIAWSNVSFTQTPNYYIEPTIIPISDERELISHTNSFKVSAFFQINIKVKIGLGTGILFDYERELKALFREQRVNDVYYPRVTTGAMYQDNDYMILPLRIVAEYMSV